MGLFDFLTGKKSTQAQMETAKKERDKFLSGAKVDDESAKWNHASGLMLEQRFQESIAAYEALAVEFPERRHDAESQIGAAYFFLGQLEQALEMYVRAHEHGFDKDMSDDNIWEACEALASKGHKQFLSRYLELFPHGKYVKKAQKLLS